MKLVSWNLTIDLRLRSLGSKGQSQNSKNCFDFDSLVPRRSGNIPILALFYLKLRNFRLLKRYRDFEFLHKSPFWPPYFVTDCPKIFCGLILAHAGVNLKFSLTCFAEFLHYSLFRSQKLHLFGQFPLNYHFFNFP